jgi:hypothetical protein
MNIYTVLRAKRNKLLGLIFKGSARPNIMFCSQFVQTMLELAGLDYFDNARGAVKPVDFIELDGNRALERLCPRVFYERRELPDKPASMGRIHYKKARLRALPDRLVLGKFSITP